MRAGGSGVGSRTRPAIADRVGRLTRGLFEQARVAAPVVSRDD